MMSETTNMSQSEYIKSRKIILENAAGETNRIGATLHQINEIINTVKPNLRNQIKVVIDTAHIFGAGLYDFGNIQSMDAFFQDFKNVVGLDKLELFHLNDSKVVYGSHDLVVAF
jgi:endonuclease IV